MVQTSRKSVVIIISIFFLISFLQGINIKVLADESNIYYVSNDGDDNNTGLSPVDSWKTIQKVNDEMDGGVITSGNNVLFKCGDVFQDTYLNIKTGGNANDEMVISCYGSGEYPILDDTGTYNILFSQSDIGYIRLENLVLSNSSSTSLHVGVNLTDIHFRNLEIKDSGHNGLFADQTINLTVENCIVHDCTQSNIVLYGDKYNRLSNTKILNCTSYNSGTGDCIMIHKADSSNNNYDAGSNHLIQNCTTYNSNEDGIDVTAGSNIVISNCTSFNNNNCGFVIGHDVRNVLVEDCYIHDEKNVGLYLGDGNNIICRNNVVFNTSGSPIQFYPSEGGFVGEDGYLKNCKVYNNIFINPDQYSGTNRIIGMTYNYFENIDIKNNIFATFDSSNPDRLFRAMGGVVIPPDDNVLFNSNLWYHASNNSGNKWYNGSSSMSLEDWNSHYNNELFSNPLFTDIDSKDFTLESVSPCIDNGSFLTTTDGSGSGCDIQLNDASFFSSGYGVTEGDVIFIGNDDNLKIISTNYDTNMIEINRSIVWTDNENVSLYLFESGKPDIGSFEFVTESPPPEEEPVIDNVIAFPNPQYSGMCINISCSINHSKQITSVSVNLTYPNSDQVTSSMNQGRSLYYLNTTYELVGTYNYYIWFVDEEGNSYESSSSAFVIEDYDVSSPLITNLNVENSDPLDTSESFGWVNLSCSIIDENVDQVYLNYSYPDQETFNYSMVSSGSNTYYFNTSFTVCGNYTYYIWTEDSFDNANKSSVYSYSLPPNWDVNNDGLVSVIDLNAISSRFSESGDPGWIREDVDNNGKINVLDLVATSSHYGENWMID